MNQRINGGHLPTENEMPPMAAQSSVSPKQGPELETLLTAQEVAAILKVSYCWVKDHATRKQPRLPCVRVGGLLRFRPVDIRQFILEHCQ